MVIVMRIGATQSQIDGVISKRVCEKSIDKKFRPVNGNWALGQWGAGALGQKPRLQRSSAPTLQLPGAVMNVYKKGNRYFSHTL